MDDSVTHPLQKAPEQTERLRRSLLGTLGLGVGRVLPWAIIASLLYAAFFIKPKAVGSPIRPPAIERRDLLFGISVAGPNRIWLAGNYGKILRSDNGGHDWVVEPSGTDQNLQDIASWDEKSAIAVGNDAVAVGTTDGGASWKALAIPRSKIANKLVRVKLAPGGIGWAVGEAGAVFHTTDAGATWTRMRPEEDVMMSDIDITDPGNLWIVGESGRMFRSKDGGATWALFQSEAKSSLMAVAFRDPLHGVAVGLDGVVLTTSDAGNHWSLIPTSVVGSDQHLFGVAWDQSKEQWLAVGNKGVWVTIDKTLEHYQAGRFSKSYLSAHTAVGIIPSGYLIAGASIGFWDNKSWTSASSY